MSAEVLQDEQTIVEPSKRVVAVPLPSAEEISCYIKRSACLNIIGPHFVNSVLDVWGKHLRRNGYTKADATRSVEQARDDTYLGLMCAASDIDRRRASKTLGDIVIDIGLNSNGIDETRPFVFNQTVWQRARNE